ncbi:MAG: hypothetical protein ACLU3G_02570 [Christensenellales bacterium]|nr:hypothetical protein [Bacillota bacterium]MDY5880334.1 hypothetical protein [Oscillospiraceae bacterium]
MLNRIDFKKLRVFLEYAVYLLLAMLLQGLLFSRLSIFGVKGFVLPAAVVAAGMYLGGVRGAVFGICLGLVTDMSYTESSFMYTIVFALIGFGAGFASEFYINKSFLVFMVMSVIAVLLSGLAQYLAAVIFGGAELVQGIVTVLLQTALSIPPMALLYLPFRNHKD